MLRQARATLDSQNSPRPRLRGSHHLPPYSILCTFPQHPNGFLSQDSQGGVPKLPKFTLLPFCVIIILRSNFQLGWILKKSCNSSLELFNGVLHSTYTHKGRVDSRLFMDNLTPGLSFCHNLCCRCPNGSYKLILDIYTSIIFQWYKNLFNARCFDPCNCSLKFWEFQWTPKFPFGECESSSSLLQDWGYDILPHVSHIDMAMANSLNV